MLLRKCPSCKETVGAESETCPRCGVNFRAFTQRRLLRYASLATLTAAWGLLHFAFHRL